MRQAQALGRLSDNTAFQGIVIMHTAGSMRLRRQSLTPKLTPEQRRSKATAELAACRLSGFFYKRGKDSLSQKLHSMLNKKRFCVLTDSIIRYYTNQHMTVSKGQIDIRTAHSIARKSNTLIIRTDRRDWYLTALDDIQAGTWLYEIEKIIEEGKVAMDTDAFVEVKRPEEMQFVEVDPDADGKGGLREASSRGLIDEINRFIAQGADTNEEYPENGGSVPLTLAIGGGHVAAVSLLLKYNANPDRTLSSDGSNSLHFAARMGSDNIVQLLLDCKANTHACDDDGTSALWVAARHGHVNVAKVLLAHGANVDDSDDDNVTPLNIASQQGHLHVADLLIRMNASVDTVDDAGNTPLIGACREGYTSVASRLLEANADLHWEGPYGPALQEAIWRGNQSVASILRESGAVCGADLKESVQLSDLDLFSDGFVEPPKA